MVYSIRFLGFDDMGFDDITPGHGKRDILTRQEFL